MSPWNSARSENRINRFWTSTVPSILELVLADTTGFQDHETSKPTTSESHQIERRPVRRTFAATAIYSCVALAAALASQTASVLQSDDEIGHVRALLSRSAQVFEIQPIDVRSFVTESAAISSGCFFVTSVWTTCTILPVTARLQTAQSMLMCDGTCRRNEAIRTPRSHALLFGTSNRADDPSPSRRGMVHI